MPNKTFRKWCPICRKLVEVSSVEERCPSCGAIIPIPPHEKFGYSAPPPPGPVPPGGFSVPPPPPEGPTHEDVIEILDRIERKVDELIKKVK
ncbi:MAG: hypothetical protein NTX55_00175 [Candidatus Parcubacteria bacterium]|nr:hypothetical protein [Candidatus Parcubacteria bacterium]